LIGSAANALGGAVPPVAGFADASTLPATTIPRDSGWMSFERFFLTAGGSMTSRLKTVRRQHNRFSAGQLTIS
jgi:hypothetical protein